MLIGKQLLEKVDELEKLGHDDQFIFFACGYSSEESFNTAFFYSMNAITHKSYKKEDKAFDPKQYLDSIDPAEKEKIKKLFSKSISETNKKNIKQEPVKGKYLATVDLQLTGKYSDEEIALACGYYETKDNGRKVASIKNYLEARETSRKRNEFTFIHGDELNIFKGRLIISDEDHGGTVFIPKRIVEQSKDWDYSKADLKDWNIEYVINEYGEGDEEAKELLELHKFDEPMMVIEVTNQDFVDHTFDRWNVDDEFSDDEIAEFYGLRSEDCHPASTWCDG